MEILKNNFKESTRFPENLKEDILIFNSFLQLVDCSDSLLQKWKPKRKDQLIGEKIQVFFPELDKISIANYKKVLETGKAFFANYQQSVTKEIKKELERRVYKMGERLIIIEKEVAATATTPTKENQLKEVIALYKPEAIKEQFEQNIGLIAKNSPDFFILTDKKGTVLFVDKVMPGYTMKEVIGSSIFDYQTEENNKIIQQCLNIVLQTKQPNSYKTYFKTSDGKIMSFEGMIAPIIENGLFSRLAIITRDITERRKIEGDLKLAKKKYWDLLLKTDTVVFSQDKQLRYTNIINPHPHFSKSILLGKTDKELLSNSDLGIEILDAVKKKVLKDGKTRFESIEMMIDGVVSYYDVFIQAALEEDGEIVGIDCISFNVTERKKGEQALIKSENRLKEAEKIAHVGYYEIGLLSRKAILSEEACRIFGLDLTKKELALQELSGKMQEEDRKKAINDFNKCLKEGSSSDLIYRITQSKDNIRYIHSLAKVEKNKKGEPIRLFGTVQDITAQKEAELQAKEQKEFIQKITDTSPSLIYIFNIKEGKNVFINKAVSNVLGDSLEEFKTKQHFLLKQGGLWLEGNLTEAVIEKDIDKQFLHPGDWSLIMNTFKQIMNDKEDIVYEIEYRLKHKKGHWVWFNDRAISFSRDKKGNTTEIMGIISDITNIKKAEMEARNAMIDGQEQERQRIATDLHDAINPLLSTAKLNIEALMERCEAAKQEEKKYLENAIELLELSMKEIKEISANLMPSLLKDFGLLHALKQLCTKISESGALEITLDTHGLEQRLDKKTEIALYRISEELLNNIIKHAAASKAEIQLIQYKNKGLVLMVSDNGKGMNLPLNQLPNTGLGFRNMQSRLKSINGKMEVDSVIGKGTTIVLEIPVVDGGR